MTAEIEGDEEEVAMTNATTKRMRVTSDSCQLAATAGQRLIARETWQGGTSPVCQCELLKLVQRLCTSRARLCVTYQRRRQKQIQKQKQPTNETHKHTNKPEVRRSQMVLADVERALNGTARRDCR